MSSNSSAPPMDLSQSSMSSSTGPRTPPESSLHNHALELAAIPPYRPAASAASKEVKQDSDRAKMPPPPIPKPHAAPRMTRMPSLSEITSHLHIPTSVSSTTPKTPPRLSLVTTPTTAPPSAAALESATSTTPFTPSGRLKLPASAMTRTRSASISKVPTLATLSAAKELDDSDTIRNGDNGRIGAPVGDHAPLAPDAAGSQPSSGSLRRQPSREYVKGYKDVPSLAAIRQRVSFSQGSSGGAAGDAQVPAPTTAAASVARNVKQKEDEVGDMESVETLIEDVKPVGPLSKATDSGASPVAGPSNGRAGHHALHHPWTLYFDAKSYMPRIEQSAAKDGGTGMGDYEKSLLHVGKIDTVESFARHMNNLRLPTQLKQNSNYHLFKGDIRPMWEDPANHHGGKWVIIFRHLPHLLDIAWANLTMALVGDILDPEDRVCGIVASNKPRGHRIQIWTRGREDVDGLNELGRRCLDMMGLEKGEEESISLEYQYNASNAHPPPNAFLYISSSSRSFTPSTPSRHGATASPNLALPSSGGSGVSYHVTPSPGSSNPSPTPAAHPPTLHSRPSQLSINVHHPNGPSPLSNNTRAENQPTSPAIITPSPSPKMMHSLPRAPDTATIKASMMSPSASSPVLAHGGGGTGMKRLGSGQGFNAFAGPMAGGARSPRAGGEGRLAPPSPVPAYAA